MIERRRRRHECSVSAHLTSRLVEAAAAAALNRLCISSSPLRPPVYLATHTVAPKIKLHSVTSAPPEV